MPEYHVTCITKPNRESVHEHITHIGNVTANWRLQRETVVGMIESKTGSFYTIDASTGQRAYVGVVRPVGRPAHLRTHADGKWNDNLLAQRECGDYCKIVA